MQSVTETRPSGTGLIWTIGHSTHPLEEFLSILKGHSIKRLIDIRTVPRSRHNPQFNIEALPVSLAPAGIDYLHMPGLGGLRRPKPDSINTGWRNASFRGYADYMLTPAFEDSLEQLIALAREKATVIMCAEAVQWRCHRSLVADALTVHGIGVDHIQNAKRTQSHKMTPFARVDGSRITYETQLQLAPDNSPED